MSKVLGSRSEGGEVVRPKLDRETWPINIRVTEAEKRAIQKALGRRGVAPVVRRALFAAAGLPPRADDPEDDALPPEPPPEKGPDRGEP